MGRDNDFAGKVIALTGGASGIGLATAELIHSRGGSVSIADVDSTALERAKKTFGDDQKVFLTEVDVSKREAVDRWIKSTVEKFGRLDGAANCAGVIGKHHGTRTVEEQDDEQWHLILNVNLTGMMYALRAELQAIKGPGSIVCVSSVQGTMGFAKHAAYSVPLHCSLEPRTPADHDTGLETWADWLGAKRGERSWREKY
jgi:NAD(P)-dependent dehydrogenase (short-subunit alcohol dehydrogenase family)